MADEEWIYSCARCDEEFEEDELEEDWGKIICPECGWNQFRIFVVKD